MQLWMHTSAQVEGGGIPYFLYKRYDFAAQRCPSFQLLRGLPVQGLLVDSNALANMSYLIGQSAWSNLPSWLLPGWFIKDCAYTSQMDCRVEHPAYW